MGQYWVSIHGSKVISERSFDEAQHSISRQPGMTLARTEAGECGLLERASWLAGLPSSPTQRLSRAILATLLYHSFRREELTKIKLKDIQNREGTPHLAIQGKGRQSDMCHAIPMPAD